MTPRLLDLESRALLEVSVRSVAGGAICLEHLVLDAAPRRDAQSVGRGPCAHSGGVDAIGRRPTGGGSGAATIPAGPQSSVCRGRPGRLGRGSWGGVGVGVRPTVPGFSPRRDVRLRLRLVLV